MSLTKSQSTLIKQLKKGIKLIRYTDESMNPGVCKLVEGSYFTSVPPKTVKALLEKNRLKTNLIQGKNYEEIVLI